MRGFLAGIGSVMGFGGFALSFGLWLVWMVGKLGLILGLILGFVLAPSPILLPFIAWIFDGHLTPLFLGVWVVTIVGIGIQNAADSF
jgi:hypothetical protein